MSSPYRDVGECLERIYRAIHNAKLELDEMSREELVELLGNIREAARRGYTDYAVHMGWVDNQEEALQDEPIEGAVHLPEKPSK